MIPAAALGVNGQIVLPAISGTKVRVKEATDVFLLRVDDLEFIPLEVGLEYNTTEGETFSRITLQNTTASDVTVGLYIGNGQIDDDRFNVQTTQTVIVMAEAAATTNVAGSTSLTAAGTEAIDASSGGKNLVRWAVTNLEAAGSGNNIQIKVGSTVVMTIFPQESKAWEGSSAVTVVNPNAGTIALNILKTYYA